MHLRARRVASLAGVALAVLCLAGAVRAEEDEPAVEPEPPLKVDYDPPRVSVEAREVALGDVLRAIGARVGFSVVETAPSSRVVTLSIRDTVLDDVLRQLLRTENHTVLYRAGASGSAESGVIDRIVLSGEPSATPSAGRPAAVPAQEPPHQVQEPGDAPGESASLPPASPTPAQTAPESAPLMRDRDGAPLDTSDPTALPLAVGHMLGAQVMVAARAARPSAGDGAAPLPVASSARGK